MSPKRRFQIWTVSLAVSAIGIGLGAVTIHQMMSGLIAFGRRYNRVEVSLAEAPILFWSTGALILLFCLALVAVGLWLVWDTTRQERRLDAALAEKGELDRSVRDRLDRRP